VEDDSGREFEKFMRAQINQVFTFKKELENKLVMSVDSEKAARMWVSLRADDFRKSFDKKTTILTE